MDYCRILINNNLIIQYGKVNTSATYSSWTLPTISSNNTTVSEGTIVCTCSSNISSMEAYKALVNSTYGWCASNSVKSGWWQVKFPYQLRITKLVFTNERNTSSAGTNTVSIWTSSNKTTQIGSTFQATTLVQEINVPNIPSNGVVTNTIYVDISGTVNGAAGMKYLDITAQKLTNALNSITFPTSFSSYYGISKEFFGGSETQAFCKTKTMSGFQLDGIVGNASSAYYLAIGY